MDVRELRVLSEHVTAKVLRIEDAVETETPYGRRYRIPVIVDLGGQEIQVSLWVSPAALVSGRIHVRSNLYTIMRKYEITRLGDLEGKEVELNLSERGFYSLA